MPIYKNGVSPILMRRISASGVEQKIKRVLLIGNDGQEHSIWQQTKQLVRFMSYDGSQEYLHGWYNKGDLVAKPSITPQRSPTETSAVQTHYTFVGWSTSPNATDGISGNITLSTDSDITYYAAYSQSYKYKITFMTYDGSQIVGTPAFYSLGVTVSPPAEPSRSSSINGLVYTPVGWSTNKDSTTSIGKITATTNAATYYAAYSMTRYIVNGTTKYSNFASGTYGKTNAGYIQSSENLPADLKSKYGNNILIVFFSADSSYGKCQYASTGISLNEIKKYNKLTVHYHGYNSSSEPKFDIGLWSSGSAMTSTNALIKNTVSSTNPPTQGYWSTEISLASFKQLTTPSTVYFGFGVVGAGGTSGALCVLDSVVFTS